MKLTIPQLMMCVALLLSILVVAAWLVAPAVANPDNIATSLLSMPIEHVNYTVARVNGRLWARIDGNYPIYLSADSSCASPKSLPMVYPTPPGTDNIHVILNETELEWGNYTQTYPTALHHTAVGDWPMINCTITNLSDFFTLKIHYEHPIAKVNDSYLFLYDLNISPYLSPENPISTAYFNITFGESILHLKSYTTETDTAWSPIDYLASYENTTQVVTIRIQSEYSKPLLGDLVIMFNQAESETPAFLSWAMPILLGVLTVLACVGLLFCYRRRRHRVKATRRLFVQQKK